MKFNLLSQIKSAYFSLHLCSFMLSVTLWVFVLQAEFNRISGQCFPSWHWSWLGLLDNQEESNEKNGSELGYSAWLLLNGDYSLPPSYHHGFFFNVFSSEGVFSTRSHCKKFCYFLKLFKQFLHNDMIQMICPVLINGRQLTIYRFCLLLIMCSLYD